jgi:hypothetical protein
MGRKLVRKTNCCDQVDFCPFRGPDAPFALRRSYHERREVGTAAAPVLSRPPNVQQAPVRPHSQAASLNNAFLDNRTVKFIFCT